jgi:hypothetical protein
VRSERRAMPVRASPRRGPYGVFLPSYQARPASASTEEALLKSFEYTDEFSLSLQLLGELECRPA